MIDLGAIRRAVDPDAPAHGNVRCPVHDDRRPSLSLALGEDGRLLVHCKSGCEQRAVFDAVRQRAGHLLNGTARMGSGKPSQIVYEYKDPSGKPLARVLRKDAADGSKDFRQQTPDGNGGWQWKGPQGATPLYGLDRLAQDADAVAVVCEGEKAAESAQRQLGGGFVCLSWMGGAGAVARADLEPLRGRDVVIWPDNDPAGLAAAGNLCGRLRGLARAVRIVRVNDLPPKADAADVAWTADELLARLEEPQATEPAAHDIADHADADRKAADDLGFPLALDLVDLGARDPVPPAFVIDGFLPQGELTLFAGHGGTGKTSVALLAAVCIAAGRDFYGLPVQRRRVGFLSCEDGRDVLHWRLRRICDWLGVSLADMAPWLTIWDASAVEPALMTESLRDGLHTTEAFAWLQSKRGECQVLVIDGASDSFDANENQRRHVRRFVRALRRLVPADGAVLLLAHVDKLSARSSDTSQGYSGSTAWNNSARARWYLREDGDGLVLEVQKSNYGATGQRIRLSWNAEAHVWAGAVERPASTLDRALADADNRERLVDLVRKSAVPVFAARTGQRTAYHVLTAVGLPDAYSDKRRFWADVDQLLQAGTLRESKYRTPDRKSKLVLEAA